jgi:hypothetical protein
MKRPPPGLVAEWYGKLRRAGFIDIELDRKGQPRPSTFPGGDGSRGAAFVAWPDADFEPRAMLADHPTAVYYRRLAQAAWDAASSRAERAFVLASIERGIAGAARALVPGLQRFGAAKRLARFRRRVGLGDAKERLSHVG